ncbi:MAG TPA: arylsulfatase [Sphingobium sp.]|uniref:arylsulfatase n=1 Tax=Sphingobium sp. TaxID=1912891 RepID=UPI002ED0AFF0
MGTNKMRDVRTLLLGTAFLLHCSMAGAQSTKPGFPVPPAPPPGAPNVLVIMTDDVGYAASSTFGGGIPTPTFDSLAQNGLRYRNFHTTALCSPSRAELLTGRNHHAVGFGNVADLAHGGEGYNSIIPKSAGTIAQILSGAGYSTAMVGKHHNIPTWQNGPLGPFDQWPSGLGFQYFYGFAAGHTNQFSPALVENNSAIEPPHSADYILDRDLADHAIDWLRVQRGENGKRPFFLYYAPGTAHTPLHAPSDWLARFKGKFDAGWEVYRQQTFERQKRLGIIPKDTRLAPPPPGVKPWVSLSPDERRLYARQMEAYAAALAYCDSQIGRVIEELRQSGQLDNTLVVYIQGDNGAEGSGAFNYNAMGSGATSKADEFTRALAHLDEIGGPRSYSGVALGWASALDTPFPYYKTIASHLGGITNGMVVSWPAGVRARGLRGQFADLTDVAPTIIEATGVPLPQKLNGVEQQPLDGVSFAYSFTQPKAEERHRLKYFEIMGHAALYKDGWFAASRLLPDSRADLNSPWELYDLKSDFSQTVDLSSRYPEKLAEMTAAFQKEAERNHVLPLSSDTLTALLPQSRPEPLAEPGHHILYPSGFRYTEGTFPSINNRSWSIKADVDVPANGGTGVIVTQGGRFSGWGLVVLKGVPTFLYRPDNWDETLFRLAAPQGLPSGRHSVEVVFKSDGKGIGSGGGYEMRIDGAAVAHGVMGRTVAFKFSPEEASIGFDSGTPLTYDYEIPFPYSGRIHSVDFDLGEPDLSRPGKSAPK